MARKKQSLMQKWEQDHPAAAAVLVFAACLVMLCLVFYFVVFSDFSSSADFIYNQF